MKNVLSTLALLAGMVAIGLGVYYLITMSGKDKLSPPLNASEPIAGMLSAKKQLNVWEQESWAFKIEKQMGDKIASALLNRKSEDLFQFLDGDFSAEIPFDSQWVTQKTGPVEQRIRITGEEQIETKAADAFWELISEPLFGVKIDRTRFEVLEINKDKESIVCTCLLEGSGQDDLGNRKYYRNIGLVVMREATAVEVDSTPAMIMDWATTEELTQIVSQPLMEEITENLALRKIVLADNWTVENGGPHKHNFQMAVEDYDLDGDYDIAIMGLDANRKLLQNQNGRYRDVTKSVGIPEMDPDPFGSSVFPAAWIDYDNDGYPDLLAGIRLFKNEGGKKFTQIERTGLLFETEIMGLSVIDYDCDGFMDIYTYYKRPYGLAAKNEEEKITAQASWVLENRTGKENRLFRNNGDGTFADVSELTDTGCGRRHTQTTAWFFYNDDHYPDLLVINDIGENKLLVNKDGEYFEDQSVAAGFHLSGSSTGVAVGDVDNDGKSDIYVSNLFSHAGRRVEKMVSKDDYPESIYDRMLNVSAGNRLFTRSKSDSYQDISSTAKVNQVGWAWAPTMLDLNSDGWLDIYSTSGFMSFDREKEDGLASLGKAVVTFPENRNKKLPEIRAIDQAAGEVWISPISAEGASSNLGSYENNKLFLNLGNAEFADVSFASNADIDADSRSVASFDVDRDGALDLLVGSAGGGPLRVFSNRMKQGNRLEIRLKGDNSNSLGVGSRITAEFGDRKIVRDLIPQNGFMGIGPANVWLGVADAEKIDKLSIRWPTGETQVFENVEVNRSVRITENSQEIETLEKWD